jgi:hypothetical protein
MLLQVIVHPSVCNIEHIAVYSLFRVVLFIERFLSFTISVLVIWQVVLRMNKIS